MWFDSWADLTRVLVIGGAAYLTVVLVLRLSGKRTLAKLNAFDLVVTVALGSTLATIVLSKDVAWSEGAVALALLALLQLVVAWLVVRIPALRDLVTAHPTLLFRDGAEIPRGAARAARLDGRDQAGGALVGLRRPRRDRSRGPGERRLSQRRPGQQDGERLGPGRCPGLRRLRVSPARPTGRSALR